MDTFEIVHIGPRRIYQQPIKLSIVDVCILFKNKVYFSIDYYDSRSGYPVVRDFFSYELQFKFSFINDLLPEYFNIIVKEASQGDFTVVIQNDSKIQKYSFVLDASISNGSMRYKVDLSSIQ